MTNIIVKVAKVDKEDCPTCWMAFKTKEQVKKEKKETALKAKSYFFEYSNTFFFKLIIFFTVFHSLIVFNESISPFLRSFTGVLIPVKPEAKKHITFSSSPELPEFKATRVFFSKPLLPTPLPLTSSLYSAYNHQTFSPQMCNFMAGLTPHSTGMMLTVRKKNWDGKSESESVKDEETV